MQTILIIANFCRKFDGTVDGRFLYLAEMLSSRGFRVELISSDFSHGTKKFKEPPVNTYKSTITCIHEPGYQHNISIRRLYSHHCWGMNVRKYLESCMVPDYIYCAVPSLTAAREAARFSKKHHVKFFIDIQDLWPEALGLVVKSRLLRNLLSLPMKLYVDKVYKAADRVIAVSDTYKNRALAINTKDKEGLSVYLGNDEVFFDQAREKYRLDRKDNEVWLCYIGSLSFSYDIECVLDALCLLKERNLSRVVRFVIIGDGPLKNRFMKYAKDKSVYVEFIGRLSYEKMVGLLCSCDIAINPIKKGSAGSIINKVGDYALSGLPVINTQECEEYRDLVDQYKCGINCEVENAWDVAAAIEKLLMNKELRDKMGIQSRKLADERFDRRKTYLSIVKLFEN
ncbi:glycosyltransferase family 4 protein [Butyricimonas paravirosa]|uniref:glycosyltransferase family 4 protein n=1 Tax=Butyricimonas paravirosa TaxID=1472417 RepID=UPI00210CCDA3|nr:glycosyltransferase family 4 protein [Butyricimonas paravirosa]MCQ4873754.1 glycosyltransferase family 4 protein [Butyricimonas paravirosa]